MGGMILLLSILGMFNMMILFLPFLLMIRNMEELTSVYLIFPKDFPTHNNNRLLSNFSITAPRLAEFILIFISYSEKKLSAGLSLLQLAFALML